MGKNIKRSINLGRVIATGPESGEGESARETGRAGRG